MGRGLSDCFRRLTPEAIRFFAHRPAWRKLIRGWISRHVYNHGAPVRLHEPVHAVFRPQVELFGMECHVRVIEPAFPLFHCSCHLDDVFWLVAVASQCRFHVTCESAFRTVADCFHHILVAWVRFRLVFGGNVCDVEEKITVIVLTDFS